MLVSNHPGFLCPLCRTFADLEDPVEIDDPVEENKPVQGAVVTQEGEANPIEPTIEAEPAVAIQPEQTSTEGASSPTPHSVQAPIFQDPGNVNMQLDASSEVASAVVQSNSTPSPSSPSLIQQHDSSSSTVSPMNIANAGSSPSIDYAAQQSPSSAFFLAPSPPMFVANFGSSIPFATTSTNSSSRQNSSSTQHQHTSSSPTSHMSNMFQNLVRNITIPHRNRSRTNSNPATPPIAQSINSTSQSQTSGPEVFGKTLVMTPPSISLVNGRAGTGHLGSELGAVSEMDVDVEQSPMNDPLEGDGNESSGSGSGGSNSRSSSQSREAHHHLEESAGATLHSSQAVTAEATV
ncbi:hypothetical protein BGZ46_003392 [Entomortierella lignicola]|nr:hypothetical protein BGZ46_003392 [Entomortierella lignicola]